MNRVKSLLSSLMLGYSFKRRLNVCVLGTAGSVMTTRSTIDGCSHPNIGLTKNQHLLVQKFRFRRLQRLYAIQAEPFFSSSLNKAKRDSTHRVNQSKNNWCKQEQQILNSCYRKKQRSGGSRPSDKGGEGRSSRSWDKGVPLSLVSVFHECLNSDHKKKNKISRRHLPFTRHFVFFSRTRGCVN